MHVTERGCVVWSDRVPQAMIRRLYESDAAGLTDDDLLDCVGTMLYARSADILYIHDFLKGEYRCPRCELLDGRGPEMAGEDDARTCPACGFALSKAALRESFRKKQLNPGGAVPAFERYIGDWKKASTAQQKMLAIDAVIHSFHYSLKAMPDMPTRAAGVNLIEGKLGDVVEFLDALSANDEFQKELQLNRALWAGWKDQPS
jgi:hypothetical protein